MADYETISWEYSDAEAIEEVKSFTQSGAYPVIITEAEYTPKDAEGLFADSFRIKIVGIDGEAADAVCNLRYWMRDNRSGQANWRSKNTLVGLGKALFGPDFKGIPHPNDMVGRVCIANVVVKPKEDGSAGFPRVYSFEEIEDYYEVFVTKPQHFRRRTGATEQ